MMNFDTLQIRREPYEIGLAQNVFTPQHFLDLVDAYPDEKDFVHMTGQYEKYSLSEVNHKSIYRAVIKASPVWQAFHAYIKSVDFLKTLALALKKLGLKPFQSGTYSTRFEFSSLPAFGGMILPHRDIKAKVVTLIIPMMTSEDWNPEWGGGTDVLSPHPGLAYPKDYQSPRMDFILHESYLPLPNQAVVFIKSDYSWHSVGPIRGPEGIWRRTLTVNVERA